MYRYAYIYTLLMLLIIIQNSQALAQVTAPERTALIALFLSTNGYKWNNSGGWKDAPLAEDGFALPGTEKDWYGIACDSENGHVLQICLSGNRLDGTIPESMGDLTWLQCLDLSQNLLSGEIPAAIGNMSALRSLYLQRNILEGSLPASLGQLDNLSQLNANNNRLTGPLPDDLADLPLLQILDIHHNKLTGPIPLWLGDLPLLKQILIHANQFTGTIPQELGQLPFLTKLDVSENLLTGKLPCRFEGYKSLSAFKASRNCLSGSIPAGVGDLPAICVFKIDNNRLSGAIPPEIVNLTTLENGECDFSNNQLTADSEEVRAFLNAKQSGGDWDSSQTECYYRGDMDSDSILTIADVVGDLQLVANSWNSCADVSTADVDLDGKISLRDAFCVASLLGPSPILDDLQDMEVSKGATLTFTVLLESQGPLPVRYSMVYGPPSATLDPESGYFSWTPLVEEGACYHPSFWVENEDGGADYKSTTITVSPSIIEEQWTLADSEGPTTMDMDLTLRWNAQNLLEADASWTVATEMGASPVYHATITGSDQNAPIVVNSDYSANIHFVSRGTISSDYPGLNGVVVTQTVKLDHTLFYQGAAGGAWNAVVFTAPGEVAASLSGQATGYRSSGNGITP